MLGTLAPKPPGGLSTKDLAINLVGCYRVTVLEGCPQPTWRSLVRSRFAQTLITLLLPIYWPAKMRSKLKSNVDDLKRAEIFIKATLISELTHKLTPSLQPQLAVSCYNMLDDHVEMCSDTDWNLRQIKHRIPM